MDHAQLQTTLEKLDSKLSLLESCVGVSLGTQKKHGRNKKYFQDSLPDLTDPYSMENSDQRDLLYHQLLTVIGAGNGKKLSEQEKNSLRGYIVTGLRLMSADVLWFNVNKILRSEYSKHGNRDRAIDVFDVFNSVVVGGNNGRFVLNL